MKGALTNFFFGGLGSPFSVPAAITSFTGCLAAAAIDADADVDVDVEFALVASIERLDGGIETSWREGAGTLGKC